MNARLVIRTPGFRIFTTCFMFAVLIDGATQELESARKTQQEKTNVQLSTLQLPKVSKKNPNRQPQTGLPDDSHLKKDPVRASRGLDLVRHRWTYNCMECHRLLKPQWNHSQFVEHTEIILDHGLNRFCLNCHHPTNRNSFVDYDGREISEKNVVALCSRCHGPASRDWKAGIHGRRNGYWDKGRGKQTQLNCIQCHDPHSPKFKPIKPLAPPTYPKRAVNASELRVHHKGIDSGKVTKPGQHNQASIDE